MDDTFVADLEAVGPEPEQRWRQPIPVGEVIRLGRAPRTGWTVSWDPLISREHVDLRFHDGRLEVRRLGTAKNPVFFQGEEQNRFTVGPREEFQIGQTVFRFSAAAGEVNDVDEQAFEREELSSIRLRENSPWQDIFAQLPRVISNAGTPTDFAAEILEMMLHAMPHADAVAVMHFEMTSDTGFQTPRMMLSRTRADLTVFRPSRRLIRAALEGRKYVLHMWNEVSSPSAEFTMVGDLDWAFCAPVTQRACAGWCLYATGRAGQHSQKRNDLLADLRFSELLAQIVGAVSQVRLLEHRAAEMAQYFSPSVVNMLRRLDSSALTPRESDVTVLFCDLRGFSWRVERNQHQLNVVFDRVSNALGVMTRNIMKFEGAVADFQGDAALAFWGWPQSLDDGPLPACRAALAMLEEFKRANLADSDPLAGFQVGIGIGHGRAIAGRIGTLEQAKVGVFGPVVNLTSRLEGLTKHFRVPIVIDEATAAVVRNGMPTSEARCRTLARVRPQGMETALTISELLPPADRPDAITDAAIDAHEQAVAAFTDGRWTEAFDMFSGFPAADRAKDYLMWFIAENEFKPPDDWDGVLAIKSK